MKQALAWLICSVGWLLPQAALAQPAAVPPVVPIGLVQGEPEPGQDPAAFASPFEGEKVTVEGVVHGLLIRFGRRGGAEYGFFLQNRAGAGDTNPSTSDGILVFTQRDRRVSAADGTLYVPRVGDEIRITGAIREIMNTTHLTSAKVLEFLGHGIDPDQALQVDPVDLTGDTASAERFWERHEGMRVSLPAGCLAQEGRHTFGGDHDAEFRVILPDSVPARRSEPYQRRVFRDPHPLDDIGGELFDNGNGYRILLGSLALKGAAHNARALLPPVRTFDTLTQPVAGAVNQRYESYSLQPDHEPEIEPGPNPTLNGRLQPLDPSSHFTVATFNVENLYDYRNDPTDTCDDVSDPGNPFVSKPFNYLPAGRETYEARLAELAIQIVRGLNAPDLILLQEVEDQDILAADNGELVRGEDGALDALQELVRHIADIGGPVYASACDRDAADHRGITTAYLYRPDRIELVPTTADDSMFGAAFSLDYRGQASAFNRDAANPKAVNFAMPLDVDVSDGMSGDQVFARAPLIARFRVRADGTTLVAINNHLSSRPDQRIGQRMQQVAINALLVGKLLAADPDAAVLFGGDLNTYPRPDDPTPLDPRDQLGAVYQAGLHNLYDDLLAARPASAYTYDYQGQAQTLDQLFVSPALQHRLAQVCVAHLNSDFPADWPDDSPYGATDHDPVVATFQVKPAQP